MVGAAVWCLAGCAVGPVVAPTPLPRDGVSPSVSPASAPYRFSHVKANSAYGSTEVLGEITNLTHAAMDCALSATFFRANGDILGTAVGVAVGIPAGGTKTFRLLGDGDMSAAPMKIQADGCG